MICYFPEIYEDETIYSWFARYYAHSGYPCYTNALEDILVNRYSRVDMEFMGDLNQEAREIIASLYPMEELLMQHTMFSQYARFTEQNRRRKAWDSLCVGEGDIHQMLPFPTSKASRYMKYCPECAREDRERYGEAYFHREHLIRGVNLCVKHRCRLCETSVELSAKKSPRLYVAEDLIPYEEETNFINPSSTEYAFVEYMTKVFHMELNIDQNVPIGTFLASRLEGTEYLSVRGKQRKITQLFEDISAFYKYWLHTDDGITKAYQIQKVFSNTLVDHFCVCQLAFFLKISVEDLCMPRLPEITQTEIFEAKVEQLRRKGLGCYRIARAVGSSPATTLKCGREKPKAAHDYSVRKGMHREDWEKMDAEMQKSVREVCLNIYHNNGGRPGRVAVAGVCGVLGFPDKRFEYLPKCKSIIEGFTEEYPVYWAREVVWVYHRLEEQQELINWRRIREITNLRKKNFISAFPYLEQFADKETANRIKELYIKV